MSQFLGQNNIYSQFLGRHPIVRVYKGDELINEYKPLYTPPVDWKDIRLDCPDNSIALYAAHAADYNQYDNLGFMATCVGGYNVFIDGVQYGSTYASGAQCNIIWLTSGITTGDNITTPSALKAHKIWISPATAGNNITQFACRRVAASGTEQQGVLWMHFNIDNQFNASFCCGRSNQYTNAILNAITAKNNVLKVSSLTAFAYNTTMLEYVPVIDGNNSTIACMSMFASSGAKNVYLKNMKLSASSSIYLFYVSQIETLKFTNVDTSAVKDFSYFLELARNVKGIPEMDYSLAENMTNFVTQSTKLQNTILDVRAAIGLKRIGCYGNSTYFMGGFKGLRVSNQAPFDNATAPQINVSYTGLDRQALVQLFNDLPTVSAGQIINILGTTGAGDLTDEDKAIATAKGWTITK